MLDVVTRERAEDDERVMREHDEQRKQQHDGDEHQHELQRDERLSSSTTTSASRA